MIAGLLKLARPHHWIKNVFVLMPLPFAFVAGGARVDWVVFATGFLGFCLVNSAVYTFNDLLDAEADRQHPRKRSRPVASGQVRARVAALFSGALAAAGLGLSVATGVWNAVWLSLLYVVLNAAYSLRAKHIALLDVFLLTSGFLIRVILGCALVSAVPSNWLLLCSSSLALFLGFTKRRADLFEGLGREHRPSLDGYSMRFLDHAMTITACVALVSYALYCMDAGVLRRGRELASMPFVVYAVLFYLREAHVSGSGGSPVEIAFRSRTIWACAVAWGLTVTWSLGLW
jgi:4-hydroxybenzoate polyprenyltransferase